MHPIFDIIHQERYSRGELLLRSFFGWLYIAIPHGFVLFFLGIASSFLTFISFWVILFTGRYPESFYELQVKIMRWNFRVNASMFNLIDGYPPFGLEARHPDIIFEVEYPEQLDRLHTLAKALLGWLYCGIPHGFILMFRMIASMIIAFLAFFIVLITGKYPPDLHAFNTGTMRWSVRVSLYLGLMTDQYPPFHGRQDQYDHIETEEESDLFEPPKPHSPDEDELV